MIAKEHNRIAGILLLAHGGLQAVVVILMCIFYAAAGSAMLVAGVENEAKFVGIAFIGVVILIAIVATILLLPQLIGGYLMLRERPSARVWGIVGNAVSCLSFPFGTAIGIYGLWFP